MSRILQQFNAFNSECTNLDYVSTVASLVTLLYCCFDTDRNTFQLQWPVYANYHKHSVTRTFQLCVPNFRGKNINHLHGIAKIICKHRVAQIQSSACKQNESSPTKRQVNNATPHTNSFKI